MAHPFLVKTVVGLFTLVIVLPCKSIKLLLYIGIENIFILSFI